MKKKIVIAIVILIALLIGIGICSSKVFAYIPCDCGQRCTSCITSKSWRRLNDSQHTRSCCCGLETATGSHSGGTATCTSAKVCSTCKLSYGSALGHTGGTHANGGKCTACNYGYQTHGIGSFSNYFVPGLAAYSGHTKQYECTYSGCSVKIDGDSESHTWSQNQCTKCSFICDHQRNFLEYYYNAKDENTHYDKRCLNCTMLFGTPAAHIWDTSHKCTKCSYQGTHSYGNWIDDGDTRHKRTCSCGASETGSHAWEHGKCNLCDRRCVHNNQKFFHQNTDKLRHSITISCSICGAATYSADYCSGGTATCTSPATCKDCKETYGSIDPNNHNYSKACTTCGTSNIVCSRNSSHKKSHECISISTHPSNTSVKENESASFTVSARGTGISYQWYYSTSNQATGGTAISGATSATYTTSATTRGMDGRYYYCVVTNNQNKTRTTNTAKLTVYWPHEITAHPVSINVKSGETASFSVTANGGNPSSYTYKWYEASTSSSAGTVISGATNSSYSFVPSGNVHERWYYCEVSNGQYTLASNRAKLTADVTKPILNAGTPSVSHANADTEFTVPITVTDEGEGFDISSFTQDDIVVRVNGVAITPSKKELVHVSTNGNDNRYTLTLKGLTSDGLLTLDVEANKIQDNLGNTNIETSMVVTGITIDNTAPVISVDGPVTGTNEGYANQNVTLEIPVKITDVGGINSAQFTGDDIVVKIGGTANASVTVTVSYIEKVGNDYKYKVTITGITGNGQLVINIGQGKITDYAMNKNAETNLEVKTDGNKNIVIDNVKPVVNGVVLSLESYGNTSKLYPTSLNAENEKWICQDIYALINSSDNLSGVEKYWHSVGNTSNFAEVGTDREVWSNEMNAKVYYRVTDKAGNISDAVEVEMKIDKTEPIPAGLDMKNNREGGTEYTYDVFRPTSGSIYIKPKVTTDTGTYQSGVLKTEYRYTFNDGVSETTSSLINGNESTTLKSTGTYSIETITTDKAGNTSSSTLYNAIIEKTTYNTLELRDLHDEGSGVKKVTITAKKQGATSSAIEPIVIENPPANITQRIRLTDGTFVVTAEIEDNVGLVTTKQKTITNEL